MMTSNWVQIKAESLSFHSKKRIKSWELVTVENHPINLLKFQQRDVYSSKFCLLMSTHVLMYSHMFGNTCIHFCRVLWGPMPLPLGSNNGLDKNVRMFCRAYGCTFGHGYACPYKCMYGRMYGHMYGRMYGPRYGPMCEPMYGRMYEPKYDRI